MKISISIIGSGNMAYHLARQFKLCGIKLLNIYARDIKKATLLSESVGAKPIDKLKDLINDPDFLVLAIKDDAIEQVAKNINISPSTIICHTSGTISSETLNHFENYGVFYPLQTFTQSNSVDFQQIPICIHTNNPQSLKRLEKMARLLSNKVYLMNDQQRSVIHLAAVFINNFINHTLGITQDICRSNNIPFEILNPLLLETISKAEKNNPFEIQTGPAVRNDDQTLSKHLDLLKGHPEYAELYRLFTQMIQKKHLSN